jgi:serine/threonine-protein kinase
MLGEGSVGIVDRVFDARLGRIVARKTLHPELRANPDVFQTFVNEARILGSLDHGGVIPIFDAYVNDDGLPVYTMREISGTSLAQVLQMDPETGDVEPLALDRSLKIVRQIVEALAHAHARGVVHLDLKPENVVVLGHDEIVLVDWGAARLFAPERASRKLESHPELVELAFPIEEDEQLFVGTPRYMSPEQTEAPRSTLGPASDIFSVGVLFYQMLTGRLPFHGESMEELLFHIRETEPVPPRRIDPGIHRRLESIVMRMLAKVPESRYVGLGEMLGDLRAFRSTAAEFPTRELAAGELVFVEGESGDSAFVIVEGEVEIWTENDGTRQTLGRHVAGETFGELALLRDMPRSASATALVPTTVRVVGEAALSSEVERLSPWVLTMMSGVVERFVDRSERLVEFLREA